MVTPYVDQKHHEPAKTSQRGMYTPSLGLDLRFEQTYLKSIAPHVRLTTPVPDENEKRGDLVQPQSQRLDIKWGKVIWITTRDQVFAPMFQGIIWWVSLSPPRASTSEFEVFASSSPSSFVSLGGL